MEFDRSKNAVRNVSYGLINKFVSIIFPFAVRTVFIRTLGTEYLGLNSLFSSILSVLNLTELGFSSAIVFSMYKPIAENDTDTINALLLYYKRVYRWVGIIILGVGLLLIPFLPSLISGSYPSSINITAVYIVYLLNSSLSYLLFAYKSALITAHQRDDVLSKTNMILSVVMYILQIIILLTSDSYYVYIAVMPLFTVFNNIRIAVISTKMFPNYKPSGKLDLQLKKNIREKIGGLMVGKLTSVTRNSFDSIFVSMYLGLTTTAIYNNYYYIFNAVSAVITIIPNALTATVGNSVAVEAVEKNYRDMNKIDFAYMWLSGWCSICLLCLYQPFMKIWVGENYLFSYDIVIVFCIYFYVLKVGDIRYMYVEATGIWWELRYRAIAETLANIILNYFLGKYFGVIGIVSATLISLFVINFCWGSSLIFKYYFKNFKMSEYYIKNLFYFIVTLVAGAATYGVCSLVMDNGVRTFLVKVLICIGVPNIVFYLLYHRSGIYAESIQWAKSILIRVFMHSSSNSTHNL